MHRLKEALIPYQFDIEYRKGQDQEAADCLSRNPVDEISGEIVNFVNQDPSTIANDQKDDPQYLLIKQRLRLRRKLDTSSHINRFIEKHHEKMFFDENQVLWLTENGNKLLFALERYRLKLMTACHNSEFGGHRDHTKTLKRILQQYWWIGLTKD